MVFTMVRAHAQICTKIDDENCLEEALQMTLEGVRQAKSSFARVVHEIWYLDTATCKKARCGLCFVPLLGEVLMFVFSPSARLL